MKTLIKNVTILTMNKNKNLYENGALLIEDKKISFVGYESDLPELEENTNIIDGKGGILTPGMINTHTHVPMVVFRSLGDDVPNRLKAYIFPLEKALVNESLVYHGARYGISE
ncbi:MAG: amidohydrolase family protein, partial [Gallicola sp.]|nr:amidohydrolase family protein [Gallicola sp.]